MPNLISTGDVTADVLSWRSASGEQVTVVVKATFELPAVGLARVLEAEPLEAGDRVPAKAGADVIVRGAAASGARVSDPGLSFGARASRRPVRRRGGRIGRAFRIRTYHSARAHIDARTP